MTDLDRAGEVPAARHGTIQAVERALDVLLCLLEQPDSGPTSIGLKLGLHKTTVYRLLRTLETRGFVAQDKASDSYRIGPAAMRLAHNNDVRRDLATLVQPELTHLLDVTEETALVDVRIGTSRICLAQAESRQEVRRTQPMGHPMELYAGAMGKVLLMDCTQDELNTIAGRMDFRPLTKRTPAGVEAIQAQIVKLRREGFFISIGERVQGATTVAVPLRDATGALVAALAISGPSFRFSIPRARSVVPHLRESAERIRAQL